MITSLDKDESISEVGQFGFASCCSETYFKQEVKLLPLLLHYNTFMLMIKLCL